MKCTTGLVVLLLALIALSTCAVIQEPAAQEMLALEAFADAVTECLLPAQQDLFEGALVAIYGVRAPRLSSAERIVALGKIMDLVLVRMRGGRSWCSAVEYGIEVQATIAGLTLTQRKSRIQSAHFVARCDAALLADATPVRYYDDIEAIGGDCLMHAYRMARYIRMAIF